MKELGEFDVITIGHFLLSLGRGGMENGVVKLINHSSKGFRHIIICLEDDFALQDRITNSNVKVVVLGRFSVPRNTLNLFRCIRDEDIDILHARGWPTMLESALVRCLLPNSKNIFAFHGKSYLEIQEISRRRQILQIFLARFFLRITTLTDFMRKEVGREFKLNIGRISVLPNGVEELIVEDEKVTQGIRNQLGIGLNDVVLGYVGRLDPVKDVETLIDAFYLFQKKNRASKLLIIGEGELQHRLKQKVKHLRCSDSVIFVEFSDQVSKYYCLFDVYVQASIYEGLSNTILEAMAHGLPVICTHVGGNADVIIPGRNGYLVPVRDAESFSYYMDKLARDKTLRKEMKKRNIEKIKLEYSLQKMAQSYEKIYYQLSALTHQEKVYVD